jgi:lysophospholipase L1-like esterase
MKKIKFSLLTICLLVGFSCEQEVIDLKDPIIEPNPTPTPGSVNFKKYVAIGTSISAGFQAAALFTDGQNESLGAILATQFAEINDDNIFHQPTIGSVNGYNATFSVPPTVILGRMILFDPDGAGPRSASPTPSKHPGGTNACTGVVTPAVPAPYNSADVPTAFTGIKDSLNNFAVPGIIAYQLTQAGTGNPANPLYNGLYARFASNPGVSTILGDALGKSPTFISFELGYNEALGYATRGGTGTDLLTAPYNPGTFEAVLNGAFTPILAGTAKAVIVNVLDVTKLPFFSLVAWNSIVLPDQATIDQTNAAYAAYNGGLDAALAGGYPGLTANEVARRKIQFTTGKNGIVILDETLTDLTPVNAGLVKMRMATAADKITLSAGAILGTRADCNNPASVYGVGVPLADQYTLMASEIIEVQTAIADYNNAITILVEANPTRLAKADLYTAYNNWVAAPGATILSNGYPVTAGIAPPLAAFSEDGVHPNGKGTAVFANIAIDAINAAFGATVNKADITKYKGTRTPVIP